MIHHGVTENTEMKIKRKKLGDKPDRKIERIIYYYISLSCYPVYLLICFVFSVFSVTPW